MINILLVEDELLVRSGMKSLIDWQANGLNLVGDVSHGKEAMHFLQQHDVDIVITDIRMPVMDGLQLMAKIREQRLPCEIVVLSSYDDFQYVRQSMKFGVRDYIHKPTMSPEEIVDTLKKIGDELYEKRSIERYQNMILDTVEESREFVVKKVLRQALHMAPEHFDPRMKALMDKIEVFKRTFYVGLLRFANRPVLMHDIRPALSEELILEKSLDQYDTESEEDVIYFKEKDHWVLLIFEADSPMLQDLQHVVETQYDIACVWEFASEPCGLDRLHELYRDLAEQLQNQFEMRQQHLKWHPLVRKAISLIHDRFSEGLTLEKVSEVIHVSPSYLSRLFYKETGKTFSEYLTQFRLKQAEYLLKQTDMRVYEIAERIGYKNSKYFLKLFKQHINMTPGEFRQKYAGKRTSP